MNTSRRGFFATLAASVGAAFLPKPKPATGAIFDLDRNQWMSYQHGQHTFYYDPNAPMFEFWPRPKIGEVISVPVPIRFNKHAFVLRWPKIGESTDPTSARPHAVSDSPRRRSAPPSIG